MRIMGRGVWEPFIGGRGAVGLLLVRAIVGVAFAFHGYPKIQHPTSWMGPHGFAPGWLQAAAAVAEFFGGAFLAAGLLTPLVAGLIFCDMFVALTFVAIPSGAPFVGGRRSFELPAVYLTMMAGFLLVGPGTLSLDYLLLSLRRRAARR